MVLKNGLKLDWIKRNTFNVKTQLFSATAVYILVYKVLIKVKKPEECLKTTKLPIFFSSAAWLKCFVGKLGVSTVSVSKKKFC